MRRSILTLMLAAAGAWPLAAQRTRSEEVKPTSAAQDARPNDPRVPEVYAVPGRIERVVILRFKFQTDLLAGLERMVKEQKIRNAVILAGAGSVRGYHVHTVSNRTFPSKNVYIKDPTAPADIVAMNGYVLGGRVHAHITLADAEKAFGGHLEPGVEVFTFAIVTLGILPDDLDLSRLDDKTYR